MGRGGPQLTARDATPARRLLPALLALPPLAFLGVFFAYPLVTILVTGLFGDALPGSRSSASVLAVLRSPRLAGVVWFTTWQAVASTMLTLLAAAPITWLLTTFDFPGRRLLRAVVTVPFVLPTTVVATAFRIALGPRGPLPFDLTGSVWAILLAHVFFNVAVVVRIVGASWEAQSPHLLAAARTLGATRGRARWLVTLPLLRPAIASAAAVVFLFTFTSLGVVLILGDASTATVEVEILRRTRDVLDLRGAAVLAILQLVFVGVATAVALTIQRRTSVAVASAGTRPRRPLRGRARLAATGIVAEVALLLGVPVGLLLWRSVATPTGLGLGYYRALGTTGRGSTAFVAPGDALAATLRAGTTASVVSLVLGGLAAAALTRRRPGGRGVPGLDLLLSVPLGTSAATLGFGFLLALDAPVDLRSSPVLVPIAHALVATPFVVRVLAPALAQVEQSLRDAARTLGASPWRALRDVDVPLVGRATAVATSFAFAVSAGEFGATVFLAGADRATVPVVIERLLSRPGDLALGQAAALSTLLFALVTTVVLLVDLGGDPLRPTREAGHA